MIHNVTWYPFLVSLLRFFSSNCPLSLTHSLSLSLSLSLSHTHTHTHTLVLVLVLAPLPDIGHGGLLSQGGKARQNSQTRNSTGCGAAGLSHPVQPSTYRQKKYSPTHGLATPQWVGRMGYSPQWRHQCIWPGLYTTLSPPLVRWYQVTSIECSNSITEVALLHMLAPLITQELMLPMA